MVVKAHINGQGPFSILIDTGASMTVISPATARRLGLRDRGKNTLVVGVGNRPVQARIVRVDELSLAGAKARNIEVVVYGIDHLNEKGIIGLLGHDYLNRFNLSFDNRAQLLTLTLPEEDTTAPARLSQLELDVLSVLKSPTTPFAKGLDVVARIWKRYEGAQEEPQETLENLRTQLEEEQTRVGELQRFLLNTPPANLNGNQSNHVQRFLYCHGGYNQLLSKARELLSALERNENLQVMADQLEKQQAFFQSCSK